MSPINMSILFYIIKKDDNTSRTKFYQFILECSKQVNEKLIVIDENTSNTSSTHPLDSNEKITIVDIDKELKARARQSKENHTPKSYNYLNILPKVTGDDVKEKNSERGEQLYCVIREIIVRYGVQAVHLCVFFDSFRSMGAAVLQKVMTANKLPLYMIHKTKCKGRFCVYNNIYFGSKDIDNFYNETLHLGLDKTRCVELDQYFLSYLSFTNTTHSQFFQKHREVNNKILSRNTFGLVKRKLLRRTTYLPKKTPKYRNPNKPYILFLLNQGDHWITNYANPELYDQDYVIRTVWLNIPSNYDLVLKPHPHAADHPEVQKIADDLTNCYVEHEQISSVDLIEKASVVIFSATTAAIVALASKKHVVELGRQSIYFDFPNPPGKRAQNLMDLGSVIEECLREEPPVDRIYAYFHAMLKQSYPLADNSQVVNLDVSSDINKRAAQVLVNHLRRDKIITDGLGVNIPKLAHKPIN